MYKELHKNIGRCNHSSIKVDLHDQILRRKILDNIRLLQEQHDIRIIQADN